MTAAALAIAAPVDAEVRTATPADIPQLLAFGEAFHAASPWRDVPVDRDALAGFFERLMAGGVIFVSDEGMIGGLLNPAYFNPAYVMAAELFWWAPRGGRPLRLAFETWAQERGARAVQFSGLVDEHAPLVARLFSRAGYVPVETGFIRRL